MVAMIICALFPLVRFIFGSGINKSVLKILLIKLLVLRDDPFIAGVWEDEDTFLLNTAG